MKISALKTKSSIALIVVIIIVLLLIPAWYTTIAPNLIASEFAKIDTTTYMNGTLTQMGLGFNIPILIIAHAHSEAKGDNIILSVESTINRTDTNETLTDFSENITYVFNKFTRKNDPNAPEEYPDENRTWWDPMYPPHLKYGENISNVWSGSLGSGITLVFKERVVVDGVTLYKYFANTTTTKMMDLPLGLLNCTLTATKTVLIEPTFGAPAYTENETFQLRLTGAEWNFVYLTYSDTEEGKRAGIENAKMAYDGMQLVELYIPTIFGVIAIILIVVLAFNIRRLKRKKPPQPKTQPSVSPKR